MHRRLVPATLAALVGLLPAAPALALEFGSSSTTGQGVTMVPLRFGTSRDLPVGAEVGLRWAPNLSSALGPAKINPEWGEVSSMMVDADVALMGNFRLADVQLGAAGRFKPIVSPYLGYRYLGVPTVEFTDPLALAKSGNLGGAASAGSAVSYNQFGGINYGVKGTMELPLGFELHTGLGLTTLISGGWDTRRYDASSFIGGKAPSADVTGAGRINVGSMTLPGFMLGGSWNLFHMFEISLGYELFALPTAMRAQSATLKPGLTMINNLQVGVRLFSFSI